MSLDKGWGLNLVKPHPFVHNQYNYSLKIEGGGKAKTIAANIGKDVSLEDVPIE